ncbi:MAG: FAD-dependent monooxygenase, partial [Terrimicrobiaceae bacterium]|nr:FAD-dependent monooxygenase [Terrimicrobiaceae bacterium]
MRFFVAEAGTPLGFFLRIHKNNESPQEEDLADIIRSAAGIPDQRAQILGVAPWVMSPKVATRFQAGRIFFAGDAAAPPVSRRRDGHEHGPPIRAQSGVETC